LAANPYPLAIGQICIHVAFTVLWGWPIGLAAFGVLICAECWVNAFLEDRERERRSNGS
tara:strand:+ start:223 stop:399 length:177 start_codon:yes stop_codon:yes gene_type:complete